MFALEPSAVTRGHQMVKRTQHVDKLDVVSLRSRPLTLVQRDDCLVLL